MFKSGYKPCFSMVYNHFTYTLTWFIITFTLLCMEHQQVKIYGVNFEGSYCFILFCSPKIPCALHGVTNQ